MQLCLFPTPNGCNNYSQRPIYSRVAREFKVTALREIGTWPATSPADNPERIADYWHQAIPSAPWFDPMKECLAVILLTTRRHIMGHALVCTGTLDTLLAGPREVFRPAIAAACHSIVMAHNHPSGDPTPSDADIRVTRELVRASRTLRIDLLDHLVIGRPDPNRLKSHISLRELGYFYDSPDPTPAN